MTKFDDAAEESGELWVSIGFILIGFALMVIFVCPKWGEKDEFVEENKEDSPATSRKRPTNISNWIKGEKDEK